MSTIDSIPSGWEYVGTLPGAGMNQPVYRTATGDYVTSLGWSVPQRMGERLAKQHAQSTTRRPARMVQA